MYELSVDDAERTLDPKLNTTRVLKKRGCMDACINIHAQTYTHIQHHEKLKVGIRQKKGSPKMDDRNTKR